MINQINYSTFKNSIKFLLIILWVFIFLSTYLQSTQSSEKAPLFFREDWKEISAETPVTQNHVNNPDLILALHGAGGPFIKKSHHDEIPNDPWYIWSGQCKEPWAISLRKKNELVDLSDNGKIRWQTKQTGNHILRIILELEDGTWLVSERGFGETPDWHVFHADLNSLTWRTLDISTIQAGERIKQPDLNRVRSIGWTDLTIGNGSNSCTRVDWIEVYGVPIRSSKDME